MRNRRAVGGLPVETSAVAVPEFINGMIERHLAQYVGRSADDLVFTSPSGQPIRYENFHKRIWTPAIQKAGLGEVKIHDLRHTAASLLIAEGAPALLISRQLGHEDITTTMNTYGHLFPAQQDELAEKLDRLHASVVAGDVGEMWALRERTGLA